MEIRVSTLKYSVIASIMIAIDCILYWILTGLDIKLKSNYLIDSEILGTQIGFIVIAIIFVFSVSYTVKCLITVFKNKNVEEEEITFKQKVNRFFKELEEFKPD